MNTFHGLLVTVAPAPGTVVSHAAVARAELTVAFWKRRASDFARIVADAIDGAVSAWRQRQLVRAQLALLASLDPATLRDLGMHDSVEGFRERDRVHAGHVI